MWKRIPFFIYLHENVINMAYPSMQVNNSRVLEINAWPKELEEQLQDLGPDDVVKVRINPSKIATVFQQIMEDNKVKSSGNVKRVGEHGIVSPWTIRYGQSPLQIGLLNGYDAQGNPMFAHPVCNSNGEIIFKGSQDREKFLALQMHPQMRFDPFTKKERAGWKWEIVDEEKEGGNVTENFRRELDLSNKIANLSNWQLDVLMSHATYERNFYGQSTLVGKPTGAQSYLIKRVKAGALAEVAAKLALAQEVADINLIKDGIATGRLLTTDTELLRMDGREVAKYSEPINIQTNESKAIGIYRYCSKLPDFKELVMDFLTEEAQKLATTSKKVK
jgi:hypothetical protein